MGIRKEGADDGVRHSRNAIPLQGDAPSFLVVANIGIHAVPQWAVKVDSVHDLYEVMRQTSNCIAISQTIGIVRNLINFFNHHERTP